MLVKLSFAMFCLLPFASCRLKEFLLAKLEGRIRLAEDAAPEPAPKASQPVDSLLALTTAGCDDNVRLIDDIMKSYELTVPFKIRSHHCGVMLRCRACHSWPLTFEILARRRQPQVARVLKPGGQREK